MLSNPFESQQQRGATGLLTGCHYSKWLPSFLLKPLCRCQRKSREKDTKVTQVMCTAFLFHFRIPCFSSLKFPDFFLDLSDLFQPLENSHLPRKLDEHLRPKRRLTNRCYLDSYYFTLTYGINKISLSPLYFLVSFINRNRNDLIFTMPLTN